MSALRTGRAFTLIEILISLAIVSILVGLLLPALIHARKVGQTAMCSGNLKQLGVAWTLYLDEHLHFPQHQIDIEGEQVGPDWGYGGADFVGPQHNTPMLADDRPLNLFLDNTSDAAERASAMLYECPADDGVYPVGSPTKAKMSILGPGATSFEYYGTSYRANPYLLDASKAGIDDSGKPLSVADITVGPSRLLLTADAVWFYGVADETEPQSELDASWHAVFRGGNMLAMDGSVRFHTFSDKPTNAYVILPRPDLME